MHELIQSYFDSLYNELNSAIQKSIRAKGNEIYGELYYYSVVELIKHLKIAKTDHFLDIGSGLGKLIFQVFLTTNVGTVTGIEINPLRYEISCVIKHKLELDLPELFMGDRTLNLILGDFLQSNIDATIVYVCGTVFSFPLIEAMAEKINIMPHVKTVISMRKLPNLTSFKFDKKIFLQGSWDKTVCYLYSRI